MEVLYYSQVKTTNKVPDIFHQSSKESELSSFSSLRIFSLGTSKRQFGKGEIKKSCLLKCWVVGWGWHYHDNNRVFGPDINKNRSKNSCIILHSVFGFINLQSL